MGLESLYQIIIVVPARINSTRLPKKVLADICGKPMLLRVLEQCKKAVGPCKVFLCTDSKELILLAETIRIDSILTPEFCNSGSERIASVLNELIEETWKDINCSGKQISFREKLKRTIVINVQGDQPFLDPSVINKMCNFFYQQKSKLEVVTPIFKLNKDNIHNESVVKVIVNNKSEAIYFSRSALPHVRDHKKEDWHKYYNYWGHVGIYGFRADILSNWYKYPFSKIEELERLEQLKLIHAGVKISTFEVEGDFLSVDSKEQLLLARELAIKNK